jgi:hypothetical protein
MNGLTPSTCSKFMAVSTEVGSVMGFLVVMASEAGLACRDIPRMGRVAADAGKVDVFALLVQPTQLTVTRPAVEHGLEFCFLKMASLTGHRHHRGRGVNLMTGDAVKRWPVTCLVAEAAENRGVLSLQRPRMPGSQTNGCGCPKGGKWPTLRKSVANGAGARKDGAILVYVAIIVTSKTSGPVAVADIVGIGRPVYLHGRKDVSFINDTNRIDRLVNLSLLIFEDVREMFGVIPFNKLTDPFLRVLLIFVIFHQGI